MSEDAKEPSPEALKIWKAAERSPGMGWLPQAIDAAIDAAVQAETDRADKAEKALARIEARIHEVIRRCDRHPQHEGTFPQTDRFRALLYENDIMGKPWPTTEPPGEGG